MPKHRILMLLIPLLTSLLSGCMNPGKGMMPKGGAMDMVDIYKSETGNSLSQKGGNTLDSARAKVPEVVLAPQEHRHAQFKLLPNPEIVLTIFPHMARVNGEEFPKPQSKTAFFLYRKNHFALPSEVY